MVANALKTTGALSDVKALVHTDSAFYGRALIGAAVRAGADVSVTVRMDPKVKAAITTVNNQAWASIGTPTPSLTGPPAGGSPGRRSPRFPSPLSPGRRKNDRVPGRLVVRRIPDLRSTDGQETLFDPWRFHAFFTTTDPTVLDTVAADKNHRGHSVIEQVQADWRTPRWRTCPLAGSLRTAPGWCSR